MKECKIFGNQGFRGYMIVGLEIRTAVRIYRYYPYTISIISAGRKALRPYIRISVQILSAISGLFTFYILYCQKYVLCDKLGPCRGRKALRPYIRIFVQNLSAMSGLCTFYTFYFPNFVLTINQTGV